jgi:primary-amine oxidase
MHLGGGLPAAGEKGTSMRVRTLGWATFVLVIALGLLLALNQGVQAGHAGAHNFCQNTRENQPLVVKKFKNGTQWSLCWEMRSDEGLIIRPAFFKGGEIAGTRDQERLIMWRASIAEIFVPYDNNAARFRDVTAADPLGNHTLVLTEKDCHGELLKGVHPSSKRSENLVCLEVEDRGIAWKYLDSVRRGEELVLWSSVQTGQYNYIIRWAFWDDGTIRPEVGLTGALQIGTVDHSHNVYWRFDIDLDGSADDRVESFHHVQNADLLTAVDSWTPFRKEGASDWDPTTTPGTRVSTATGQSWRVMDKALRNVERQNISYELIPNQEVLIRGAPGTEGCGPTCTPEENFTNHDIWVTSGAGIRNLCELFPDNNRTGAGQVILPATCDTPTPYPKNDVTEFITPKENVDGQDVILWYALHSHHRTRAEDKPTMLIHWAGPTLQPRDFFDRNPLAP